MQDEETSKATLTRNVSFNRQQGGTSYREKRLLGTHAFQKEPVIQLEVTTGAVTDIWSRK